MVSKFKKLNKTLKQLILLILFFFSISVFAQNELIVPIEFQKAYKKGTRSLDGKPGSNYWQNHSDYKINAEFSTATRTLSGCETITYYNESPDFIGYFLLRLYQDLSRPESEKDWEYSRESFSDGVKITKIIIDGKEIDIENETRRSGTNIKINYPVNPNQKYNIFIEWSFQLPAGRSPRMGRYDTATYMIAYWYPQMSVYDDIDGFDFVDYAGQVEYYNDFCNFDVNIAIDNPNCMVWATGELQNPEEIFNENFVSAFRTTEEDKIFNFITNENRNSALQKKDKLLWHYKADNVPDFAFSFSDRYVWDFVNYKPESGRNVRINTAYNPDSKGFDKVCKIAYDAIRYFSTEIPAVPFPYPSMTVFNGSGGMEFPMMVNDSENDDFSSDVYLTSHEISHTYFPFFMGINERKYAWMDEGWAMFIPQNLQTHLSKDVDFKERKVNSYLKYAGTSYDVPLMVLSHQLKSPSYRIAAYQKSACSYDMLENILGENMFKECLKEYIRRWNGKHPSPFDFFNTFKDVSGENLDWFFKPWYFEFGYPDLTLVGASEYNKVWSVEIEKKGNYPVPVCLSFETVNKKNIEFWETAKVWSNGNKTVIIKKEIKDKIVAIKLGNKYIPDINLNDNKFIINK